MSRSINLGCSVASVHHRYNEIHSALFGAASFRLVIDALRGKRRLRYKEFARTLVGLRVELVALEEQITDLAHNNRGDGADRELNRVLLDYTRALGKAIVELEKIVQNLEQDELAYRDTGIDSRSRFSRDKVRYDHLLSELVRLGTRLNRLFSAY